MFHAISASPFNSLTMFLKTIVLSKKEISICFRQSLSPNIQSARKSTLKKKAFYTIDIIYSDLKFSVINRRNSSKADWCQRILSQIIIISVSDYSINIYLWSSQYTVVKSMYLDLTRVVVLVWQRVLSRAYAREMTQTARLVCMTGKFDHITPI